MVACVSVVHDVAGSHDAMTAGPASVSMRGTPLTPAECVRNVDGPGSRHSVCNVTDGHVMMTGMSGKKGTASNSFTGEIHNMRRYVLTLMVWLCASSVASAQFEGEIYSRITTKDGNGFAKVWVSKMGTRSEIDIHSPTLQRLSARPYRLVTLQKISEPDLVYHLNDERKVYAVINLKKVQDFTNRVDDDTYTLQRLGKARIADYECEKVRLTSQNHTETDLCIAQHLTGMTAWVTMLERTANVKSGMLRTLQESGLDGFPIQMVVRRQGKESPLITTEVVRVDPKTLASSLFTVPDTYKRESAISSLATSEMVDQMKSLMQKMPPEQQRLFQDMKNKMMGK